MSLVKSKEVYIQETMVVMGDTITSYPLLPRHEFARPVAGTGAIKVQEDP
jgi:hypothetical protein